MAVREIKLILDKPRGVAIEFYKATIITSNYSSNPQSRCLEVLELCKKETTEYRRKEDLGSGFWGHLNRMALGKSKQGNEVHVVYYVRHLSESEHISLYGTAKPSIVLEKGDITTPISERPKFDIGFYNSMAVGPDMPAEFLEENT